MSSLRRISFWGLVCVLLTLGGLSFGGYWEYSLNITSHTSASVALQSSNARLVVVSRDSGPEYPEEPTVKRVLQCWSGIPPRWFGLSARSTSWKDNPVHYKFLTLDFSLFAVALALVILRYLLQLVLSNRARSRRLLREIRWPSGPKRTLRHIAARTAVALILGLGLLVTALSIEKIGLPHSAFMSMINARLDVDSRARQSTSLETWTNKLSSRMNCTLQVQYGRVEFSHVQEVARANLPRRFAWQWRGIEYTSVSGWHYLLRQATTQLSPQDPTRIFWTRSLSMPYALFISPCVVIPAILFMWGPWRRSGRFVPGFCRQCSYDLTGLTEPRCPECGTPFKKTPPADPTERPASYPSK